MTSTAFESFPRLRPIDPRPIEHEGRPYFYLRDPLALSEKTLIVPQPLAPVLALCDGTREDASAISTSLALRFNIELDAGRINDLIRALDEACLLDNGRAAQAKEQALLEYRRAEYREPALAGASYPADPEELRELLNAYLNSVDVIGETRAESGRTDGNGVEPVSAGESCVDRPASIRGLVSPHIDYARGGPVYAAVWKHSIEAVRQADLVVLFGTDHYGGDRQFTLTRQNFATPFGVLPTDRPVVEAVAEALGEDAAFAAELNHRNEHSIELAAVWLHFIREGKPCNVVPILCGSFHELIAGAEDPASDPAINRLLGALTEAASGRNVLAVAAADLAHIGPAFGGAPVNFAARATLKAFDDELIERICECDAPGFFESIRKVQDQNNVCGVSPIYLTLRFLQQGSGSAVVYDRCPADDRGTSVVSVCGAVIR